MASERGIAQTAVLLCSGVVGPGIGVTKLFINRTVLERQTVEGDSPVSENDEAQAGDPEYHGAR